LAEPLAGLCTIDPISLRPNDPDHVSDQETGAKMRAILLATVLTCVGPGIKATAQTLDRQWAWCRGEYSEHLIPACTSVIQSHRQAPDDLARAFFYRGRALSARSQFDRAIQDFDQAIQLDPAFPDAFNFRGVAWAGNGQFERAIADFDHAIQLDPNYAVAIYNRGLAAQNLGRADEASRYFEKAKQAGPRLLPPKD
jgi:tetratricopeptide (TPR) repeat protein